MNSKMKKTIAALVIAVMGALGGGISSQLINGSDSVTPQDHSPALSAEVTQEYTETAAAAQNTTKNADDEPSAAQVQPDGKQNYVVYTFRNRTLLEQHFSKHGSEFDYATAEEYEKGASDVINSDDALHKTEAEDGDGIYYIEDTNEFVVLSTDGYIRTYFKPNDKKDYYDRQ